MIIHAPMPAQLFDPSFHQMHLQNFRRESEIQKLFVDNFKHIFRSMGLKFIGAKDSSIAGGEIDILAINREGGPTIIELKIKPVQTHVPQCLSYLTMLEREKSSFEKIVQKRYGLKVNWSQSECLCIAPEFSELSIFLGLKASCKVRLIQYFRFSQQLLLIDRLFINAQMEKALQLYSGKSQKMVLAGHAASRKRSRTCLTLEGNIALLGDQETREAITYLDEQLFHLIPQLTRNDHHTRVSYRTNRIILKLSFRKDWALIQLSGNVRIPAAIRQKFMRNTSGRSIRIQTMQDVKIIIGFLKTQLNNLL